jgi:hypothetical protein
MRIFKLWAFAILALAAVSLEARQPDGRRVLRSSEKVKYRDVCANSRSQIDQAINNVRARLLGGGDCWWDFADGRYIVPKVDPASGQREVSSIFAGSVWLGGIDPGNNLKLACQDYRSDGRNDFWPGPLTELGITESFTCSNWDRHFRVTGEEIRKHLANIANGNTNPADIPRNVRGWPARGNQYFVDVWGFDLPFTQQALAGFFDVDEDGLYEPLEGDYPSIEIRGCPLDKYPDEMIFWIYNDHGGGQPHARTNGRAIQMEVQVQAFGYTTNDELNDMTFQRYKLINRATDRIDSTFFAMWVDADLGCSDDDYIGCDTAKSLMYIYNQDAVDGQPGANCAGGVATYGNKIPLLGVDYFRGPLGVRFDTIDGQPELVEFELGMNSFMYYNRTGTGPPGTADPTQPEEYYNYITGTWRDGTPLTYGGSGYAPGDPSKPRIRYCFTEVPNNQAGWSMCTANLPLADRRTLQATGPFTLLPGAVNELIIGIPWVPDIQYPCPDMEALFRADKLAQGLFDSCFDLLDGPDAPTADWIELNKEVIVVLTNKQFPESNNFNKENEDYEEVDFLAPEAFIKSNNPDSVELAKYKFEGYLIYQLKDENVSAKDFSNPERGRLVYQVDVKNGIKKIFNWEELLDPFTGRRVYYPVQLVDGADTGIRHTFSMKEDLFASGNDKRLINHKKYYYAVVAYAYNNFSPFDPFSNPVTGQQRAFLAGRRNIEIKTVIPRPVVDLSLRANYGDGVVITRLEGVGTGNNFLDLDDDTREKVISGNFDSTLTYRPGRGPLAVTIFNPFEVKDGEYELAFVDGDVTDTKVDNDARWELRRLPDGKVIKSEKSIDKLNEQIVLEYGFSVTINQVPEPGTLSDDRNGGIGAEIEYADPNNAWLLGLPDDFGAPQTSFFNFVRTAPLEVDAQFDPKQGLSTLGNGWFVPYVLCSWNSNDVTVTPPAPYPPYATPAWTNSLNNAANGNVRQRLAALPNVDIVLTSDKSKWSRCAIIETANRYFTDNNSVSLENNPSTPNKPRRMFDTRYALSVGKDDNDGDGLPDPDGAVWPQIPGVPANQVGQPMRGMGWFPGYAVDVETGQRLNIFFGENSGYSKTLNPNFTGRDMLWNPTDQFVDNTLGGIWGGAVLGGQHWIYVANTPYDQCERIGVRLNADFGADALKVQQVGRIAWAGMIQLAQGAKMKSLREGLIPTDVRIKLRVNNSYQTWFNDNDANKRNGHPRYRFKIEGKEPAKLDMVQIENALDSVKVVPNPYYGFSEYETSQFTNTVKITNLPGKCRVTIFSLDGKFIRQYNRDEQYMPYQQISPAIEWDLKNNKGIPVASGVYLIHITAPDMGERTIKWFGIGRQFDPSGL